MKDRCAAIDKALEELVSDGDYPEQPDARSFGGFVERAVLDAWGDLCAEWNVTPCDHPGRRTIYDASFVDDGAVVGVDFRTKDLADDRYSDGGVCAVANLLRWMVRDKAILVISEFGYTIADGVAAFSYVASAPAHTLPLETYRIENLGTGQIRLNQTIRESLPDVDWSRSPEEFFSDFAPMCIAHYATVCERASSRIAAVEAFIASEYSSIALK